MDENESELGLDIDIVVGDGISHIRPDSPVVPGHMGKSSSGANVTEEGLHGKAQAIRRNLHESESLELGNKQLAENVDIRSESEYLCSVMESSDFEVFSQLWSVRLQMWKTFWDDLFEKPVRTFVLLCFLLFWSIYLHLLC